MVLRQRLKEVVVLRGMEVELAVGCSTAPESAGEVPSVWLLLELQKQRKRKRELEGPEQRERRKRRKKGKGHRD